MKLAAIVRGQSKCGISVTVIPLAFLMSTARGASVSHSENVSSAIVCFDVCAYVCVDVPHGDDAALMDTADCAWHRQVYERQQSHMQRCLHSHTLQPFPPPKQLIKINNNNNTISKGQSNVIRTTSTLTFGFAKSELTLRSLICSELSDDIALIGRRCVMTILASGYSATSSFNMPSTSWG